MNRIVQAAIAAVCLASTARAANVLWIEGTADYNTPSNWLGANVPSSSFNEVALINNGGTAQLAARNADTPSGVRIGPMVGSSGGLDILSGGSLSATYVAGAGLGQVEVGSTSGGGKLSVLPGGSLEAAGILSSAANPANKIELGGEAVGTASVTVGAASLAGTTIAFPAATLAATSSAIPGATGAISLGSTSVYSPMISSAGAGRLIAQGSVSLNGSLAVAAVSGFAPTAGATFDLLDWGTVSGSFSSVTLPPLASELVWNTSQLYGAGVVSVRYAGDFDFDNDVDGTDLIVWQQGGSPNPNSASDLAAIEATFGLATATPVASAVPEPGTIFLVRLAAFLCLPRRLGEKRVRS